MEKELFFIETEKGDLASCLFKPDGDVKALIVTAHGYDPSATMSEHAGLTPFFAKVCCDNGYAVLLFDFRGHGLSDCDFKEMTPCSRIEDLDNAFSWAFEAFPDVPVFSHGFSMGGATAIYSAAKVQDRLKGLITWCAVPSYDLEAESCTWHPKESNYDHVEGVGDSFLENRPEMSIEDAYVSLALPKIQVQGNADLPFFLEEFVGIYNKAQEPKQHHIIDGADHCFSKQAHREEAVGVTVQWIKDQLSR